MSDPTANGPSEEELRAYLESLRAAQPVEVLVQSFGILATASEVKLGRGDARVLIDAMTALVDATDQHIPPEIATRMRQTITQLQMAQVEAEREGTADAATEAQQQSAPSDPSTPEDASAEQTRQESPASRLWIPGRD
jgi:hypothetical protein